MYKNIARTFLTVLSICLCLFSFPTAGFSQYDEYPADDSEDYFYNTDSTNAYDYYFEGDDDYSSDDYSDEDYSGSYDPDEYRTYDEQVSEPQYEEPSKPVIPPGPPIKLAEKTIRIGRVPYLSIKELMRQAVPLLRLLQKKTGAKSVRLVSSRSGYSSILDALARGNIDFAWVGPAAYVKHRDHDHLMAIAKARFGDETGYKGVFIAPAKGRVQGLEDMKDGSIAFVDKESASGFIYPMYLLKSLKIKLDKNTRVYFLKSHDKVLQAVLSGKVDSGVCLEETLNSYRAKDKDLDKKIIILGKTPEVPSDVIVCRQDCPINLRESFQEALTQIKPGDLPVNSPTFLPAYDDEFASVEQVMKFIGALSK
ncbi:MAG: hypothetical protein Kow0029_28450 [Candidatus Rifleibacteriota bacterium]